MARRFDHLLEPTLRVEIVMPSAAYAQHGAPNWFQRTFIFAYNYKTFLDFCVRVLATQTSSVDVRMDYQQHPRLLKDAHEMHRFAVCIKSSRGIGHLASSGLNKLVTQDDLEALDTAMYSSHDILHFILRFKHSAQYLRHLGKYAEAICDAHAGLVRAQNYWDTRWARQRISAEGNACHALISDLAAIAANSAHKYASARRDSNGRLKNINPALLQQAREDSTQAFSFIGDANYGRAEAHFAMATSLVNIVDYRVADAPPGQSLSGEAAAMYKDALQHLEYCRLLRQTPAEALEPERRKILELKQKEVLELKTKVCTALVSNSLLGHLLALQHEATPCPCPHFHQSGDPVADYTRSNRANPPPSPSLLETKLSSFQTGHYGGSSPLDGLVRATRGLSYLQLSRLLLFKTQNKVHVFLAFKTK